MRSVGRKKHTAGIALYRKLPGREAEILLVHPTGTRARGTWSIPKGHGEDDESLRDTAVRETAEEVSIGVPHSMLRGEPGRLYRRSKKRSLYYWLIDVSKWNLLDTFPLEQLQATEIDQAKFVPLSKAGPMMTAKQIPMLMSVALAVTMEG